MADERRRVGAIRGVFGAGTAAISRAVRGRMSRAPRRE